METSLTTDSACQAPALKKRQGPAPRGQRALTVPKKASAKQARESLMRDPGSISSTPPPLAPWRWPRSSVIVRDLKSSHIRSLQVKAKCVVPKTQEEKSSVSLCCRLVRSPGFWKEKMGKIEGCCRLTWWGLWTLPVLPSTLAGVCDSFDPLH